MPDLTPAPASSRPAALAIWHGYLLGATGSNIYTRQLVRAWTRSGRDVVLACQETHPERYPELHEAVWLTRDEATGEVSVRERRTLAEPAPGEGRCTMVVPDVHGVLPVYVLDRYAGFEVVRLPELDAPGRARYAAAQAAAMRWVLDEHAPAGVLINHATPLPAALGPVLDAAGVPYAVKVHGSELEYAIVDDASLAAPAATALERAASVLVGSAHIAARTAELLGAACLDERTHTVPPGVDLVHFTPIGAGRDEQVAARAALADALDALAASQPGGRGEETADRVTELVAGAASPAPGESLMGGLASLAGSYQERNVEPRAAAAVRAIAPDARLVTFVGKLIPQKGVHLVVAAWPEVLAACPDAHLVIAGFGPERDRLEALLVALATGNRPALELLAADLPELAALVDVLRDAGELDAWLARASALPLAERVTWLGLVDHAILAHLWPLCEVSLVPSILAEAFGMVAAEAAACGSVPIVSDHSGLGDAAAVIELDDVSPVRVPVTPGSATASTALAAAIAERLALPAPERERQAAAARTNVARAWGWDQIAAEVADLMTRTRVGV